MTEDQNLIGITEEGHYLLTGVNILQKRGHFFDSIMTEDRYFMGVTLRRYTGSFVQYKKIWLKSKITLFVRIQIVQLFQ